MSGLVDDPVGLADWRRQVTQLYAAVREDHAEEPHRAHEIWRSARDDLFATHSQTPLEPSDAESFTALDVYDYNPDLVFAARLDTDVEAERFPVGTSGGGTIDFVRVGRVDLPVGRLDVFWLDSYGGGIFLPFRDATSGDTTYGGGRYLLDTVKGADLGTRVDGELRLDFNFAYHPSCHYAPSWSCPLAPPDNRLDVAVTAGERSFR